MVCYFSNLKNKELRYKYLLNFELQKTRDILGKYRDWLKPLAPLQVLNQCEVNPRWLHGIWLRCIIILRWSSQFKMLFKKQRVETETFRTKRRLQCYHWLIEMFVFLWFRVRVRFEETLEFLCFCDWLIEMFVWLPYLNIWVFAISSFKCLSFCDWLIEMLVFLWLAY